MAGAWVPPTQAMTLQSSAQPWQGGPKIASSLCVCRVVWLTPLICPGEGLLVRPGPATSNATPSMLAVT